MIAQFDGTDENVEPARGGLGDGLAEAVRDNRLTVITGARGLGQDVSIRRIEALLPGWTFRYADGDWTRSGYLSGFHDLIEESLAWAEANDPELVGAHEQTLKRILPTRRSDAYVVPRDLTNSSRQEERTRFYHYEYQNKLLVGSAEFLRDTLMRRGMMLVLVIEGAEGLSPTARGLVEIVSRLSGGDRLKMILMDHDGRTGFPGATPIRCRGYSDGELVRHLGLQGMPHDERSAIIALSSGSVRLGRALLRCQERGVKVAAHLTAESVIDLYLASLDPDERAEQALAVVRGGMRGDIIALRNAETDSSDRLQAEHERQHEVALALFRDGRGPLVLVHALALRDKHERLRALVAPCEILKGIGLYDTWFSFFAPMFADGELRGSGDGDEAINGLFINAAFVLYAMGSAAVAAPFLTSFLRSFPSSHFGPTVLYAQSMIFGRYRKPVDLDKAQECALENLALIAREFRDHERYIYIKVFAENALAYIRARQGRFAEALSLCEAGLGEILDRYGDDAYRLHRSILVYNTSQVYELVGDAEKAESRLRQAMTMDPHYAEYHNDLGNLLSSIDGREADALVEYGRAITLSPPYHEAHLNRGLLRVALGDRKGAVDDFERVLEIRPAEWRASRELGNLKLLDGDFSGALAIYDTILARGDGDADLHANAGLACSELGLTEQALFHYRAAVAIDPAHVQALNNLALDLAEARQLDEALLRIRTAAARSGDAEIKANLAAIEALAEAAH